MLEEDDTRILYEILAALDAIGSQLSAADHVRDYDPWGVIADTELEIKHRITILSESFFATHGDLLARFANPDGLHLVWGDLKDEIERMINCV